jgi:hypothetical protein
MSREKNRCGRGGCGHRHPPQGSALRSLRTVPVVDMQPPTTQIVSGTVAIVFWSVNVP